MNTTKYIILFCLALFASQASFAQKINYEDLRSDLRNGDTITYQMLIDIICGNKKNIQFVSNQNEKADTRTLAIRAFRTFYKFSSEELDKNGKEINEDIARYFISNRDSIHYSKDFHCWFKISFEKRRVEYLCKPLLPYESLQKGDLRQGTYCLGTGEGQKIDSLLKIHDSKVLLELCKLMSKGRSICFAERNVSQFIKELTGLEISVKNSSNKFVNHFSYDLFDLAKSNYISFWIQNYKSFKWNSESGLFESDSIVITERSEPEIFYDAMTSDDDSIALDAYKKLVNSDETFEHDYGFHDNANKSLPIFWNSFRLVIGSLQKYYNVAYIENCLPKNLMELANKLIEDIPFKDRYKIENELIKKLDLETVTSFEVLMLYNERNEDAQWSAARILDEFYSNNWDDIISNTRKLEDYLKKAELFDNLGIVGVCNYYLYKFEHSDSAVFKNLDLIQCKTNDNDILESIKKINSRIGSFESMTSLPPSIQNNFFSSYSEFQAELDAIYSDTTVGPWNHAMDYIYLSFRVPFNLIANVLDTISDLKFLEKDEWKRYDFIYTYYGIPVENLENDSIRKDFQVKLTTLSKREVYEYYLKKCDIEIWNEDGSINYKEVYRILKYGFPVGFVGNRVARVLSAFPIIKILECKHNTTLGYEERVSFEFAPNAPNIIRRCADWRYYLIKNNLVEDDNKPISFVQWGGI